MFLSCNLQTFQKKGNAEAYKKLYLGFKEQKRRKAESGYCLRSTPSCGFKARPWRVEFPARGASPAKQDCAVGYCRLASPPSKRKNNIFKHTTSYRFLIDLLPKKVTRRWSNGMTSAFHTIFSSPAGEQKLDQKRAVTKAGGPGSTPGRRTQRFFLM